MRKRQQFHRDDPYFSIGQSLRKRRKELQLSMQVVADRAGLSVGFISQVERDLTAPSLVSLNSIALVLGLPISSLLDQPKPSQGETRKQSRQTYKVGNGELSYERLSTRFDDSQLHSVIVHEPPGHRYEPISHPGEELFFILSGMVAVEVEGEVHVLAEGDSIHFDSHRTHSSWNHGTGTASFLWCGTMDMFGDQPNVQSPFHNGQKHGEN
ncbi:helix-turn-helix domain-containing protein [Kiloniella sp. b19]|uniref:helix-turn-helix domain-containing protein n=1 Tax=Kiloniella sp. GXU_MW_B19 TaxID=3141326 RepID=UPI0031D9CDC6